MSHETFDLIDRLRRAGRRATMATLVRTAGTTPRKEGTKMFVGNDGNIFGSVTIGGCVDARVIEQSNEVLSSSAPRLINLQLGDEEAWEIGLTCGGAVDVLVEPLNQDVMKLYETAQAEWKAGRAVGIATVISGEGVGARVMMLEDGTNLECGGHAAALDKLDKRAAAWPPHSRTIGDVYIEVLRPPSTLIIFGASAVAIPLVTFAKTLGFRTIVVDGRARFASRERFPDADDIRVGIVSEIAGQMQFGPTTPIVLVAHDYKIDVPVLEKALASDAPYIGLLGSRRRGATILQMLRDAGVAPTQLARVRTPIGLDLGGETAADIALSIVSEVIAITHGRSGSPLSAKSREPVLQPT
jgi:xanthine dehydrogenase accessory factor